MSFQSLRSDSCESVGRKGLSAFVFAFNTFSTTNLFLRINCLESSSTPTVAEKDEQINVSCVFTTKRGALLDTYQDESSVKVQKMSVSFCEFLKISLFYSIFLITEKIGETDSNEKKSRCRRRVEKRK